MRNLEPVTVHSFPAGSGQDEWKGDRKLVHCHGFSGKMRQQFLGQFHQGIHMSTVFPAVHGRINDLDSHLQVAASQWGDVFGEATAQLARPFLGNVFFDDTKEPERTTETVWQTKGTGAPGAATPEGRLATMDVMGIDRQLIFPQIVLAAPAWSDHPSAGKVLREYNDAVLRWTKAGKGRLRPTALLNLGTIEGAIAEAERVIDGGARAVFIQDGIAPGGYSPAASEVDPLWALLAKANVPVTFHIGGQQGFFGSAAWQDTELLRPGSFTTGEPVGPHMLATMHMSPQNYLTCMIFGGVFDRHPALRVGLIELGAMWVGPFVDLLEDRIELSRRVRSALKRRPKEIFSEQIRVTPFFWEKTARQIERYGMPEIYAFSTDFPHPEGGTDPIGRMGSDIKPLGDEAVEAFFVRNAALLLPD
jgi:predicted TIM-barrel fold metal-dependent hydrolase